MSSPSGCSSVMYAETPAGSDGLGSRLRPWIVIPGRYRQLVRVPRISWKTVRPGVICVSADPPAMSGSELDLRIWGKSKGLGERRYPLACHLLDAAAAARLLWECYVPPGVRKIIGEGLGVSEEHAGVVPLLCGPGCMTSGRSPRSSRPATRMPAFLAIRPAAVSGSGMTRPGIAGFRRCCRIWGTRAATRCCWRSWPAGTSWHVPPGHAGHRARCAAEVLRLQRGCVGGAAARCLPGDGGGARIAGAAAEAGAGGGHAGVRADYPGGLAGQPGMPPAVTAWRGSPARFCPGAARPFRPVPDGRRRPDTGCRARSAGAAPRLFGESFPHITEPNALQRSIAGLLPGLAAGPGLLLVMAPPGVGKTEAGLYAAQVMGTVTGLSGLFTRPCPRWRPPTRCSAASSGTPATGPRRAPR